ncbi:MAG TPA: serine/threonine-protein kinase, partial [Gemmatirosa sp.]
CAVRDDVGLRVALKLLRDGRGTPSAVRRLLAERRVLARLDHPNVARLLDAGVTENGAPYFAMEYVDGAPLVDACDARQMDVRGRVALFATVCDAVAYAHAHHVVHRDLKPANVFVRADGVVKLLDFGIAKLLAPDDAPGAASAPAGTPAWGPTSGMWLMTPRYAAPEQRRGEPVTPASDVFALGLVLEELLTGRRPPRYALAVATLAQAIGAPTDPDASAAVDAAARLRSTTSHRLQRAIAGDLDAIIRRATADDPAGRYADAGQLADDLRLYLADRPVRARPHTVRYRAAKLVHRIAAYLARWRR